MNNTIFAVDDQPEILELYQNILGVIKNDSLDFFSNLTQDSSQNEFDLHCFETGEAYLEELKKLYANGKKLPLSLLDMRLPGKHGFEVAKLTREIDPDITIIILSAYSDYSVKEILGELNENIYYMHKPFRVDEFYLLVVSSLKQWNAKFYALDIKKELAIDSIEDGLWDWNIITDEVCFSPQWKHMLGYEESEVQNKLDEWSTRVHPDDLQRVLQDIEFHFQKKSDYYVNEHRMACKDGSYKWILDRGKVIFGDDGKPARMTGFHTDITHRKSLEEELLGISKELSKELELKISLESKLKHTNLELETKLKDEIKVRRQKEQMLLQHTRQAAMGEMISMIAHQWRQPLTSIGLSVDNVLIDIALDSLNIEELQENLNLINKQVHYLSQTIDDFRNFFQTNKEKEKLLVHECIEGALTIINKILSHHNITIQKSYTDSTPIALYKNELTQVILNLLKNAQDIFQERSIAKPLIEIQTRETQDTIELKVIDNGGGISAEAQTRVFEPYFTTKNSQNGTGLGLYMSKTIIEEHMNGSLTFENTQDGVCFSIKIPKN